MSIRTCLLILGLACLAGCGSRGPGPHPGDIVHVEGLNARLTVEEKAVSQITLRFMVESPGATERVALEANDIVPRVQPQILLRFFKDKTPLAGELVLPLGREC